MRLLLISSVLFLPLLVGAALNCPIDSDNKHNSVVKIIKNVPGDEFYCTGTIIKNCYILTAAHCLTMGLKNKTTEVISPSAFTVRTGINSETLLSSVKRVIPHPQYNQISRVFDVALIQLSSCDNPGLEIDYSVLPSERNVTVGGYGAVRLRGWEFQPIRHMGKNVISRFDENEICVGTGKTLVMPDGKTIKNESGCVPAGQDSGSALLMNNRIRGVFKSSKEDWKSDGSTLIQESCYTNLRNPVVQNFIEENINSTSGSSVSSEENIEN